MYNVYFKDKKIWKGGDIEDSKWNKMPKKPISKIEYNLFNRSVSIGGFEKYNHIIEHVSLFNKKTMVTKTILMGLSKYKIYKFIFDLNKTTISYENIDVDKEYLGKKTTGWKQGIKNSIPKVAFNEIRRDL